MDAAATEGKHLTCRPRKKASVQLRRWYRSAPPASPSLRSGGRAVPSALPGALPASQSPPQLPVPSTLDPDLGSEPGTCKKVAAMSPDQRLAQGWLEMQEPRPTPDLWDWILHPLKMSGEWGDHAGALEADRPRAEGEGGAPAGLWSGGRRGDEPAWSPAGHIQPSRAGSGAAGPRDVVR